MTFLSIKNDLLGALLLLGVVLNIAIAQRHDEDAIAAQATLILLVVGSARRHLR